MSEIQDEAYSEVCEELELKKAEIGALRREIGRRNAEIEQMRGVIKRLCEVVGGIMDEEGHYPSNAPLRKLIGEALEMAK